MTEIEQRFEYLLDRLRTAYDGVGHSSGRPYVYFVYPPDQERAVRRLADESFRDGPSLRFHKIDLLELTIDSLRDREEQSQRLLNDPAKRDGAANSILRLWVRAVGKAIDAAVASPFSPARPVIVLSGLAALHPLGNPTSLMEALAESEPRDPVTNRIVPVVLLVPGVRPPQTSRTYQFLGLKRLELSFYRGEEI